MDDGAVETFGIVLEDQLPVGMHVVVDATPGAQAGQIESAEAGEERRERLRERLQLLREIDEEEPLPSLEWYAVQGVIPLVEPRDLVHVGCADQRPVQRVRPRV